MKVDLIFLGLALLFAAGLGCLVAIPAPESLEIDASRQIALLRDLDDLIGGKDSLTSADQAKVKDVAKKLDANLGRLWKDLRLVEGSQGLPAEIHRVDQSWQRARKALAAGQITNPEVGQFLKTSGPLEAMVSQVRSERRGIVLCLGAFFFFLCVAGRRFVRLSIEHPLADAGQRLKLFQEVIASNKQHTEDLVATIPCGVMVCAPDLTVLSMNRACREMFGLTQEQPGAGLDAILPSAELHNNAVETLFSGLPRRNFAFKALGGVTPATDFLVSMARSYRHTNEPCLIISFENVTQLDALRQAEGESNERFNDLFNGSDESLMLLDERELIVDFNPAAERNSGFSREEVIGKPLSCVVSRPAHLTKSAGIAIEVEARKKQGGAFPAEWLSHPVRSRSGKLFAAHLRDLTARTRIKLLEQDCLRVLEMVTNRRPLGEVLSQLASLMERQDSTLACAISVMRNGRLDYDAARSLPADFVKAISGLAMGPKACSCGTAAYSRNTVIVSDIATDPRWAGHQHLAHAHDLHASWSSPIFSGLGTVLGVVAMFRREPGDPSPSQLDLMEMASRLAAVAIEQWNLTNMLSHQAQYDSLTKLPNRVLFEERLSQAVVKARQNGHAMALLYIDLDRFKLVNDTLGHTLGDSLLTQATERLRAALRQGDMLARMGGDEFAVILQDLRDPQIATAIGHKLLDALKTPFNLDGYELFVTASIGVSMFPRDGSDVATLLRNADSAMYRAKDNGKNGLQCFAQEMSVRDREQLDIESYLHRALERDELSLYYQPQYEVLSGRLVALETLLRWKHPTLGVVLPGKFIPAAEQSGLILPIGDWVLRQASAQNRLWQHCGHSAVTVGVNVSARQFEHPNFVESLANVLTESGMNPRLLELELTETLVLRDVDQFVPRLNQLRDLGVRIAIDDFGAGYSSLNYLQRLPVDTLKLDKSFMDQIKLGTTTSSLIESIVDMTHNLGMLVTAEGVETEAQLETLTRAGCDRVQGFLLSKPMTTESAERLLGDRMGIEGLRRATGRRNGSAQTHHFGWEDRSVQSRLTAADLLAPNQ